MTTTPTTRHIRLTSHPGQGSAGAPAIVWGAADALARGPVVGSTTNRSQRNVIGTHSGSYGVYRALAVAAGNLTRGHRADLTDTSPTDHVALLADMCRHHLLLPDVATRRDIDDPDIIVWVADQVGSITTLELLDALTEADSIATGPSAWSRWNSRKLAICASFSASLERMTAAVRWIGEPSLPRNVLTPMIGSSPVDFSVS